MYALILATGVLGLVLNQVFVQVERRVLHWHPSQRVDRAARMTGGRRWLATGLEVAVPLLALGALGPALGGQRLLLLPAAHGDLRGVRRHLAVRADRERRRAEPAADGGRLLDRRACSGSRSACFSASTRAPRRAAAPIVEFLRAIPPPALLPFAILVIGVGDSMKIFIIAFVCLWPVLLNTIDGVRRRGPRRCVRPPASTGSGRATGSGGSCCRPPRRRSSPACARVSRSR